MHSGGVGALSENVEHLVAALIDAADQDFLMQHPETFAYGSHSTVDSNLLEMVDQHLKTYGKMPDRKTVAEWGYVLPKASETAKFYLDRLRPIHLRKTLQAASIEAAGCIKENPEKAFAIIAAAIDQLRTTRTGFSMVDFRTAQERILKHLSSKWSNENYIGLGWDTFDDMSGGLMPGDFITLSAPTGIGKTYLLLSRAFYLWKVMKVPVLFVSMEMSLEAILERAAAIQGSTPFDYVKKGIFPNLFHDFKKQLIDALEWAKTTPVPFWFVDGNLAATAEDLGRLCNQLQPRVTLVDGAYLLGGIKYKNRWELIAENASFMKQVVATQMRQSVIASYQFTKASVKWSKKKGGEAPGLEDIAGSQEVPNLASIALGVSEDKSPTGVMRRKVEIMKGRGGEAGTFYTNWDFYKMNFDEVDPEGGNEDDYVT